MARPADKAAVTIYMPKELRELVEKNTKDVSLSRFVVKAMKSRIVKLGWVDKDYFKTGEED